jgi:hypothetical protein
MIAHNGIGAQVNGKHGTQQLDSIYDPLASVFEVKTSSRILTTQKGTPYAA